MAAVVSFTLSRRFQSPGPSGSGKIIINSKPDLDNTILVLVVGILLGNVRILSCGLTYSENNISMNPWKRNEKLLIPEGANG